MTWEERWHPLREELVVVAAHRPDRPWNGEMVVHAEEALPEYVDDCYLCPGNNRVSGKVNSRYTQTFAFDNDQCLIVVLENQGRQLVPATSCWELWRLVHSLRANSWRWRWESMLSTFE